MSMFVTVVRLSPKAFKTLEAKPSLLGAVADEDPKAMASLGVTKSMVAGFDYRFAAEGLEAMDDDDELGDDEEDGDDESDDEPDALLKDLRADGSLKYDAGYGPAFVLSPKAVKKAKNSSSVLGIDEDVKALFGEAAKRGDYVVGFIS